jgi:hypothetical protein
MSEKCTECGAVLSSYNPGQVCYPCQKKRKDRIVERITSSKCERMEYLDFLMVSKTSERIMALPQKMSSPYSLHIQGGGSSSTRNRQDRLESIEDRLVNGKPRIQISLNPLAVTRPLASRTAVRLRTV